MNLRLDLPWTLLLHQAKGLKRCCGLNVVFPEILTRSRARWIINNAKTRRPAADARCHHARQLDGPSNFHAHVLTASYFTISPRTGRLPPVLLSVFRGAFRRARLFCARARSSRSPDSFITGFLHQNNTCVAATRIMVLITHVHHLLRLNVKKICRSWCNAETWISRLEGRKKDLMGFSQQGSFL